METNYIALAIPAFFILIMLELVVTMWQGKDYYRFNDAITDLSCGIGQQLIGVLLKTALFAGYIFIYEHYALIHYAPGSALPWVVAFFAVDFVYYWWHRASHQINLLWAAHVVHHQSEDFNLAVALRQAWFTSISSMIFNYSIAFLGVPPLIFLAMSAFNTLYQFWIHTRLIGKLGALEWVLNTPSHHRVHHGRDWKYLDRNHGGTLIIWDRLFGTFQVEEEEPRYGTVKPYLSLNPIWANFYYLAELAKLSWRAPYFVDKIKVWFMYPGWYPREVDFQPLPAHIDAERRIRYNPRAPLALNIYIGIHFAIVALATSKFVSLPADISLAFQAGAVLMVLVTVLVWGGMFEKRAWALPLELARLAVLAAAGLYYYWPSNALLASAAVSASIIFAVWLLINHREKKEESQEKCRVMMKQPF